jgi:hypothetical protein
MTLLQNGFTRLAWPGHYIILLTAHLKHIGVWPVVFYELWFDVNFLTFKLRFEIGLSAFSLARPLFWLLFKKIGRFFTNHLVTLLKLAVISPYCKDLRLAQI